MDMLRRLMTARRVAIIGGGVWGRSTCKSLQKFGFVGEIYQVHPTAEDGPVPVYRRISDMPHAPDAAFVAVNRALTIRAIAELREIGAGGAICFASGFAEAGAEDTNGRNLQAALLEAAGNMPVLGPNCYGFINALDGVALWPDEHGLTRVDRGVAIVTQSSNILINLTMQLRGLPVGLAFAAGNQAQIGISTLGLAALSDERITALGLHIEGIDDLRAFEALASEAHRLGKPVVVLKVGRSEQAQSATISHTASLAGGDAGATALFERLGVARVSTLSAFLEALKLASISGYLPSRKVGSVSCSGGEASLSADLGQSYGLTFPPLTERQKTGLREALGPLVALANPLDYHTYIWGDVDAMTQAWAAMIDPDLALLLFIVDFPREDRCNPDAWECTMEAISRVRRMTAMPLGMVSTLPELMTEHRAHALFDQGIVPFNGISDAYEAIASMSERSHFSAPVLMPSAQMKTELLSESAAKSELSEYGLRVPKSWVVTKEGSMPSDLIYPCVLKGQGLAHKTEAGAVVLNLSSADEVASARRAIDADVFLIEEQVSDPVLELLIGVTKDPAHGFVLTVGAGGVFTELLEDTRSLLVPDTRERIATKMAELKIAPRFNGYRGFAPISVDRVLDAIDAVQDYVVANSEDVEEVEINPLIVTADDAIAVDALIRRSA